MPLPRSRRSVRFVTKFTRDRLGAPLGALGVIAALLLVAACSSTLAQPPAVATAHEPLSVDVYLFVGRGCPYCEEALEFLHGLKSDHPTLQLHAYEVWYDEGGRELLRRLAAAFDRPVQGVPTIFLGDEMWTGFAAGVARDLRDRVERYERVPAPDPMARLGRSPTQGATSAPNAPTPTTRTDRIEVPLVGAVDLTYTPLILATALIGLVDGVNPCSVWVLALLIGVMLGSGSRRRVLLVGATFLAVSATVYGGFVAGLFGVLAYLSSLAWIRAIVAFLAAAMAAIHLKDYLAFRRGVSLTIPDARKPAIYRGVRAVVNAEGSPVVMLAASAALALGVTLVELPCTVGLPVVWSALVADAGIGAGTFAALLGLYMLLYLLDELAILAVAVFTLKAMRLGERGGRILKLLSAAVMATLAVTLLAFPETLGSIGGTLGVFSVALGGAGLIAIVHRWAHPASSPLHPTRDRS